jgi:hypothetical protein
MVEEAERGLWDKEIVREFIAMGRLREMAA